MDEAGGFGIQLRCARVPTVERVDVDASPSGATPRHARDGLTVRRANVPEDSFGDAPERVTDPAVWGTRSGVRSDLALMVGGSNDVWLQFGMEPVESGDRQVDVLGVEKDG
jgi:hypothetical protein